MKQIKDYEHYYATTDGRIFSKFSNRYLKSCKNKSGYPSVALLKNGKQKTFSIHRLVALTYLKDNGKKYVNHIDGNKENNNVSNLEFVTFNENIKHAWDNGLYENTRLSSLKKANKIVIDLNNGVFYNSLKEASLYSKFDYRKLIHMLSGHSRNVSNYIYA